MVMTLEQHPPRPAGVIAGPPPNFVLMVMTLEQPPPQPAGHPGYAPAGHPDSRRAPPEHCAVAAHSLFNQLNIIERSARNLLASAGAVVVDSFHGCPRG